MELQSLNIHYVKNITIIGPGPLVAGDRDGTQVVEIIIETTAGETSVVSYFGRGLPAKITVAAERE